MRMHLNLLHVIATAVPVIAWAYGWPWFICLPIFIVLFVAAVRVTKFHDDLEINNDKPND